jgi:Tfp pilus assembly protein PilE
VFSTLSNIERLIAIAVLAVLVLCVIGVSYYAYNTHRNYTEARNVIKNQALRLENSEIQKEYLTNSLNLSEKSNDKLLKERDSLAKINEQYNAELITLNAQHSNSQQQIKLLRQSTNETVKDWANDCVPFSAISLLKYARAEDCHTNSRSNETQVRDTTKATSSVVPNTTQ